MATILDRVDTDRISVEAREIHPGRTLLTVIAAVLYAIGWLLGTIVVGTWVALAWSFTAIRIGWQDAARARLRSPVGPA